MSTVLFIRGEPGTGKATVGRILEQRLGWPMLWVHDFDPIYKVLGTHRVPKLTDKLFQAATSELLSRGLNCILVRPARHSSAVIRVGYEARLWEAKMVVARLTADYSTLVSRVSNRMATSPARINTKSELDEYLNARTRDDIHDEHVIATDNRTPEQVADAIQELL